MTKNNHNFWKLWSKFVILLILILTVWILILVAGNHFFPKEFNKFKFIHYFLLIAVIFKVRNGFLKKIKENRHNNHEE